MENEEKMKNPRTGLKTKQKRYKNEKKTAPEKIAPSKKRKKNGPGKKRKKNGKPIFFLH